MATRAAKDACDLLDVEATSIWLRDPQAGDLVLHLATGFRSERMVAQRVPAGHGIIGHVVDSGETVVVNDVRSDGRFYRQTDASSGFVTRSILCVPLRAPRIELGGERGATAIIGEVVRVTGQQGAWSRVKLDDGRDGWIESAALVSIDTRDAAQIRVN